MGNPPKKEGKIPLLLLFCVYLYAKHMQDMKYYEVNFTITPASETSQDILSALLAETGFETFVPTERGLTGYVQQSLWDTEAVEEAIGGFPLKVTIAYDVASVPDEDWNQTWEEEGFEPIYLDRRVCIHDTKHLQTLPCTYDITINPRMAFGTGTHPTTQMILRMLTELDLGGKRIVDAGCGTGVLGILAMKRGARGVLAYDIDEWSTENTALNFSLNGIDHAVIRLGDSAVLDREKDYDVLIANINRNILLGDIQRFVSALRPDGELILSGFYTADAPMLIREAGKYGKKLIERRETNDWCLLRLG